MPHDNEGFAKVPAGEVGKVAFGPAFRESRIELVALVLARAGFIESAEVVVGLSDTVRL